MLHPESSIYQMKKTEIDKSSKPPSSDSSQPRPVIKAISTVSKVNKKFTKKKKRKLDLNQILFDANPSPMKKEGGE